MNGRQELIDRYVNRHGGSIRNATDIITEIIQDMASIITELEVGEIASFTKLGNFKKVIRAEREGHNPRTGDIVHIPAKETIKFKMSPSVTK